MINDALSILEAIRSAKDAEEKQRLENELLGIVQSDIKSVFDNPQYPKRKRSFRAIQGALGIFDDDPQELKEILFKMGARPTNSKRKYWHLPKDATRPSEVHRLAKKRKNGPTWSLIITSLGALAAFVTLLTWLDVRPKHIYCAIFDCRQPTLSTCLTKAAEIQVLENREKAQNRCFADFR